jgi:hypothetical protein
VATHGNHFRGHCRPGGSDVRGLREPAVLQKPGESFIAGPILPAKVIDDLRQTRVDWCFANFYTNPEFYQLF